MCFANGTQLGPYEIVVPMGEMYTARDTRLDRVVAIIVAKENEDDLYVREQPFHQDRLFGLNFRRHLSGFDETGHESLNEATRNVQERR